MTSNPSAAQPAPRNVSPTTGSREAQIIRIVVYVMLALNGGIAVLFGDRVWQAFREGHLPVWAPLLLPGMFTVFVAVYAVDRWILVRRHRYPLSRALFQVSFALAFLTLLLPQQASELNQLKQAQETGASEPALQLLTNTDEGVRAAACGLLTGRYPADVYTKVQHLAHTDPSLRVRTHCTHALERLHQAAQSDSN